MGTLFVDKLDPQSGTSLELGSSGDTDSVNTGATTSLLGNVTLGASGKTITVPTGCTITNSGTASGFGGITQADMWQMTSNITEDVGDITANWSRYTGPGGNIGSALTESSGIFSFPSTCLLYTSDAADE